MQRIHILNGDCLAEQLKKTNINPDFIICRECLIDGGVNSEWPEEFWKLRGQFLAGSYHIGVDDYYHKTVSEFEKLQNIPEGSEVCLWFENDLFCQVNMWFILYILSHLKNISLWRVFPTNKKGAEKWEGFANSTVESLEHAYTDKEALTHNDVQLGKNLWLAYQKNDFERLRYLARTPSSCFVYLPEVVEAHIERFPADGGLGRPQRVVQDIIQTKSKVFNEVLAEFSVREGVYGLGDLQVRSIFDKII